MKKKFLTKLAALMLIGTTILTSSGVSARADVVTSLDTAEECYLGYVIGDQGISTYVRWVYYSDTKTLAVMGRNGGSYIDTADMSTSFYNALKDAESIYICDGVTNIGDYAFYSNGLDRASKATYVRLPGTVREIGRNAFGHLGEDTTEGATVVLDTTSTSLKIDNAFSSAKIKDLYIKGTGINWMDVHDVDKITNLYLPDYADRDAVLAINGVSESTLSGISYVCIGDGAQIKTAKPNTDNTSYTWDDDTDTTTTISGKYYFDVSLTDPGMTDDNHIINSMGYMAMISLPTTVALKYGKSYAWQDKAGYAYESGKIYPYGTVADGTTITLDVTGDAASASVNLYNMNDALQPADPNNNVTPNASAKTWTSDAINSASASASGGDPVKLGIFVDADTVDKRGMIQVGSYQYHVTAKMGSASASTGDASVISDDVAGLYDTDGHMVSSWQALRLGSYINSATVTTLKSSNPVTELSGHYQLVLPSSLHSIQSLTYGEESRDDSGRTVYLDTIYIPSSVTDISTTAIHYNDKDYNQHTDIQSVKCQIDTKPSGWSDFDASTVVEYGCDITTWPSHRE